MMGSSAGRLHLVGLGWLGAVLADSLHDAGVPFTWHDTGSPTRNAWRASTGCVYPDGDHAAQADYDTWGAWLASGRYADRARRVDWWYTTKQPPHGAHPPNRQADIGFARCCGLTAITVDVPGIVMDARDRYAAQRLDAPPPDARIVYAHGHHTAAAWTWGWSANARLDLGPVGPVASLHLWASRFRNGYAYAAPDSRGGQGHWLVGSAARRTNNPAMRTDVAITESIDRWHALLTELTHGECRLLDVVDVAQGHRPVPASFTTRPEVRIHEGQVVVAMPAMIHSGVRRAPTVIARTLAALEVR
jgi:hypothetical protein